MYIDVYIDALFAVNFLADLYIFGVLTMLTARKARVWRLCAGAAVCAGLYAACVVWLPWRAVASPLLSAPLLCAGVAAAFCPVALRLFARLVGWAYGLAFLLGGCATAFAGGGGFPAVAILCAMALTYVGARAARRAFSRRALARQTFCGVSVSLNGKRVELTGLVDTGNTLLEPISGAPVIVAWVAALKALLPPPVLELFREGKQDDLAAALTAVEAGALGARLRMVPYAAVGREGGLLLGFRPDEPSGVIIALSPTKLSDEYNALVNPAVYAGAAEGGAG